MGVSLGVSSLVLCVGESLVSNLFMALVLSRRHAGLPSLRWGVSLGGRGSQGMYLLVSITLSERSSIGVSSVGVSSVSVSSVSVSSVGMSSVGVCSVLVYKYLTAAIRSRRICY